MSKLPRRPDHIVNFLDDEGLSAFFDLKAELAFYLSIPGANRRRDRHSETIAVLERWFTVDASQRHKLISDHVIKRNNAPRRTSHKALILRSIWARAEEFYSLDDLKTPETLKAAYRKAVKVCHPDVGGTHEDMIALNESFEELHELIITNQLVEDDEEQGAQRSISVLGPLAQDGSKNPKARDALIAWLWVDILIDGWNLDAAAKLIQSPLLPWASLKKDWFEGIDFFGNVQKLIDRCYALNRPDICRELMERFLLTLNEAAEGDRWSGLRDHVLETRDGRKRRVILKHVIQQHNAKRLSPELRAIQDRPCAPNPGGAVSFSAPERFAHLPYDPPSASRPADPSRIPYPEYHEPPTNYSTAQCWEYHQAFYGTRSRELIDKYQWGRASSCMMSLILSEVASGELLEELILLGKLFPKQLSHLSEASRFLRSLDEVRLRNRLRDLRELDCRGRNRTFPNPLMDEFWYEPQRFIVSPSVAYAQTIVAAEENIVHALRTGCLATKKERRDYVEAIRREEEEEREWRSLE